MRGSTAANRPSQAPRPQLVSPAPPSSLPLTAPSPRTPLIGKPMMLIALGLILMMLMMLLVGLYPSFGSNTTTTPSSVTEQAPSFDARGPTSHPNRKPGEAYFIASKKRNKFHVPTCEWARKINPTNLVEYTTKNDAINEGKEPCKDCIP